MMPVMTTPFAPLEPRGAVLGDEVYALLGEAILDGRLAPGERLRDQELAERSGVSRTPVREALQRLERTGLVEVSPNRYTRVSAPSDKVQADTHEFFVYLMGNAVRIALPALLRRGARPQPSSTRMRSSRHPAPTTTPAS